MRIPVIVAGALIGSLALLGAGGCGGPTGPVQVTPEIEQKLKQEQEKAASEERQHHSRQAQQSPGGVEDEERRHREGRQ